MWGKWHRTKTRQTNILDPEKCFYELVTYPGTEVTNLILPNDDGIRVSWKYSEEQRCSKGNMKVAVNAYVTSQARLNLSEYLSYLGQSVLYCDIELVSYIQKDNDHLNVKKGDYLGDLTDDLDEGGAGFFIEEFVSVSQEKKSFRYFAPRPENVQQSVKRMA
jgi:hypothetical protein